jgi:D-alanyl-D-alanine carboxypeptidase
LQDQILTPLGMTETSFPDGAALPEPFARGYTRQGIPEGVEHEATFLDPSWGWAVGNLISTVGDLAIWAQALGRGTLLSAKMQAQRLTPVPLPPNSAERAYALGIGVNQGWWGHTGELPGYNTVVYYRPDVDATLVVVANHDFVEVDGRAVSPAVAFAARIIAIGAREAPLGALHPDDPTDDPSLRP